MVPDLLDAGCGGIMRGVRIVYGQTLEVHADMYHVLAVQLSASSRSFSCTGLCCCVWNSSNQWSNECITHIISLIPFFLLFLFLGGGDGGGGSLYN